MSEPTFSTAAALVLLAVAEAITPAPDTSISEWVDLGEVILTERTNTPKPGPFSFEGVEYLREPLDRCHPDDPASTIPVIGGAQTGKSSIGQLWVCWSIKVNPKSFVIGLPSDGEVLKYNDFKLQPLIEDSPSLASRVRPVSTKADLGSSTRKKRLYMGASILVINLNSPKELQMISTGNLILEEVANLQADVGGRGSPVKQARERQAAYSVIGSKELMVSTPGRKESCAITAAYEASDQRRFYGKCPACGDYFCMEPEGFKMRDGSWGPHFICQCGVPLFASDRAYWRTNGIWIPTFKGRDLEANPAPPSFIAAADIARCRGRDCEGRGPGYYVWQAMCGFISFEKIVETIRTAKTPAELEALEQQVFGRAYDESVEAIAWEELHRLREDYDQQVVPAGAGILTGFCDVQGDYLQWQVLAFGPGAEWWVVDRGIIQGDTAGDDVWRELDELTRKRYPHVEGGELGIAAFGVDTGYRTQRVYAFVRGRANCFALDGRPDWKTPVIGKPKPQKVIQNGRAVGRVKLFPTGTWELKSLLAWSLKQSLDAGYKVRVQGRGHWSKAEDESWAQEMTSEALVEEQSKKTHETKRFWKRLRKNEYLDCWVGARALAWMLGVGAPRRDRKAGEAIDWSQLAAERVGQVQDLFQGADQPAPAAENQVPTETPSRKSRFYPQRTG
jgi:phage terminase large subunit GpA-like protein